jgi:hypothetical protein
LVHRRVATLQGVADVLHVGHCSCGQETCAPGACHCLYSR